MPKSSCQDNHSHPVDSFFFLNSKSPDTQTCLATRYVRDKCTHWKMIRQGQLAKKSFERQINRNQRTHGKIIWPRPSGHSLFEGSKNPSHVNLWEKQHLTCTTGNESKWMRMASLRKDIGICTYPLWPYFWWKKSGKPVDRLIGSFSHYLQGFYTLQVVVLPEFFHITGHGGKIFD